MITVRLPATLRSGSQDELTISDPVTTIDDLVTVLDHRIPGLRDQLDDSVFSFAVNDEILLQGARTRTLRDGDTVEIIPTISGG
jgi:molybdopterin converting factor small subunit